MSTQNEIHITKGMQEYIDKSNVYHADRTKYIEETVKKWKFDTIACSASGEPRIWDALKVLPPYQQFQFTNNRVRRDGL